MTPNQRPHSRQKTVGSGTAGAHRGKSVQTGPVGSGGRQSEAHTGSTRQPGSASAGRRAAGKPLSLKSILILAVVVIAAVFILKNFGGSPSEYTDPSQPQETPVVSDGGSEPDLSVSPLAREKYVAPAEADTATVMLYMCGTDLESKYGMATKDLQEIMNAELSDQVNVIIETGGCKQWKNNTVSNSRNQIYRAKHGAMELLEEDFGNAAMTDPKNLTEFIRYCQDHYPADRNLLIFWDHGGGSLSGYGYDEKNTSASSMTLPKIRTALGNARCTFDCIGFDACLMATLETALVCEPYADYLLASEETEPGTGWYYTRWLTELSEDPAMPTVQLGKTVIDDFVASSGSSAKVTLSLTDLAELSGTVPNALRSFSESTDALLRSEDYARVSAARADVRQFAQSSKINQVDLADLALRIDTEQGRALAEVLQKTVKYNRSTISRCNGLSIYFPYENTASVKNAVSSYENLGMDSAYTRCIQSFASLEYGGQIAAAAPQSTQSGGDLLGSLLSAYTGGSSGNPLGALLGNAAPAADPTALLGLLSSFSGRSMPEGYDWVDTELIAEKAQQITDITLDPSRLVPSEKDGATVLSLTDAEWDQIQTVELNVYAKDEGSWLDLGLDNTFEWYDDSSLLLDFDGTWLTINGNVCAYYMQDDTECTDGSWITTGIIPALLNGQPVNLQVVFDAQDPEGTVTGAYPMYEDETQVLAKGEIAIEPGDTVQLLCDCYGMDGSFETACALGDAFTVPDSGLALTNLKLDNSDFSVTYRLTDRFGNHYWLPVAEQ